MRDKTRRHDRRHATVYIALALCFRAQRRMAPRAHEGQSSIPFPNSRPFLTFVQNLFARGPSAWDNPEPVREELFSAERIEEHARSLAAAQKVTPKPIKGHPLAARLAENGAVLLAAYKSLLQGGDEGRVVTPAAEWLIDNYHLVEKQIREIRSDLPPGYYRQLPKLADGPFAGYPARVRRGLGVRRPHRQPLRPGDAAPLPARLSGGPAAHHRRTVGGVDHAAHRAGREPRRIAQRDRRQPRGAPSRRRSGRSAAGRVRQASAGAAERRASPITRTTRARTSFAVQLIHRLRDQDPSITPALDWLDERLAAQGPTADDASCATCTSGRSPPASPCATSSPACA